MPSKKNCVFRNPYAKITIIFQYPNPPSQQPLLFAGMNNGCVFWWSYLSATHKYKKGQDCSQPFLSSVLGAPYYIVPCCLLLHREGDGQFLFGTAPSVLNRQRKSLGLNGIVLRSEGCKMALTAALGFQHKGYRALVHKPNQL